ncbi:MAG: RHS repeat protein, partial [Myxococcales bacterium]|nr:RHS repeat protein [Myxococcales bacterium]
VQENGYDWKFRRVRRVEYVDEAGLPLSTPRCTAFVYDLYDRLIAEHDGSADASTDPAANVVAEYVYLEGYHVLAVRRSGQWYWYANDHLPAPRKLVDAAGTVVWDGRMEPFGVTDEVVAAVAQPLRFPGQVGDGGVPLVANGVRTHAPAIGRLLSVEPALAQPSLTSSVAGIGVNQAAVAAAIVSRVGRLQAYSYAANAPIARWDFQGRWPMGYEAPNYDSVRDTYACAADWIGSYSRCMFFSSRAVVNVPAGAAWAACFYYCPKMAGDPSSVMASFLCRWLCANVLLPVQWMSSQCIDTANRHWACDWGIE